jgi:hypothetical protein
MLLHGMNDCTGSYPVCIPDRPRVLNLSLRKISRAVDRTLPCGAESFSVGGPQGVDLGCWISVSRWSCAIARFAAPSNGEEYMEVISSVLGHIGKALVRAARRTIRSSKLEAGRSIPPRSRPFDVNHPRIFGARAMSCRQIVASVVVQKEKEKSKAPDSCQYVYKFRVHAHATWTKSLPAIGHHSSTLSHEDYNRKPV